MTHKVRDERRPAPRTQAAIRRRNRPIAALATATPGRRCSPATAQSFPLVCPRCGTEIRVIAFITDPPTIHDILVHLGAMRAISAPVAP